MTLIKSISGIRGTVGGEAGDNLTPSDIVRFTVGYSRWLLRQVSGRRPVVAVGRDARLSGEMVYSLVEGTLMGCGVDVIDLGLCTTPGVEMAVTAKAADGGIIITASHNPRQWNALKLLNARGEFLSDADGSVIYGSSWDNLDFGMLYWKDGKVDWAGSDVRRIHTEINRYGEEEICVDAMRCMADLTQISPNGKWIAGAYRYEIMEDGNYHIETYPAVFNTETGKTVIIKDYGERVVSHITNDGIVCIANSSYLPDDGFMYDVNTQTNLGSVSEWIRSNYGIIAPRGYIRHISADGQYLMAHTLEPSALTVRVVGWYLAPALEK